jgi:hypothetical protein
MAWEDVNVYSRLKTESVHRHRHSAAAVRSIDILTGLTRTLGFCLLASMFNAILIERDPGPYRASLRNLDEAQFLQGKIRGRIVVDTNRARLDPQGTFRVRCRPRTLSADTLAVTDNKITKHKQ